MKVTVGNTVFTATLADNSSTQALKELLADGSLTINMRDYANMEKVGPIGRSLPENNEQITTEAGDIILYLGNSLVIYYDTNSWNFTRIGKIRDVTQDELKAAIIKWRADPETGAWHMVYRGRSGGGGCEAGGIHWLPSY